MNDVSIDSDNHCFLVCDPFLADCGSNAIRRYFGWDSEIIIIIPIFVRDFCPWCLDQGQIVEIVRREKGDNLSRISVGAFQCS
jgi:hypothetical protein